LSPPVCTYRVQFGPGLGFRRAREILPYLRALGVSHVYASPLLKARAGSTHGYDVVSHRELNPDLGSEEDFRSYLGTLSELRMGQVLDIVPNHMCILGENLLWQDVLEHGPSSPYARYFDIHWQAQGGKVLMPVLGKQYGQALQDGELVVLFQDGAFRLGYYEHLLPLEPRSYRLVLAPLVEELQGRAPEEHLQELRSILTALEHLPPFDEARPDRAQERRREAEVIKRRLKGLWQACEPFRQALGRALEGLKLKPQALDALLQAQPYRLCHWVVATEEINYRRFFDINELAALRVEDQEVFQSTHELLFRLLREGAAQGLRVDHADGLYDPGQYLRRLQAQCQRLSGRRPFYIVVEKILLKGERLVEDWPVAGTTGYEFLNALSGLFVHPQGQKPLSELYARFTGQGVDFQELLLECKRLVLETSMAGELSALGERLSHLAQMSPFTRDFTRLSLTRALAETIAAFPVYRTYINHQGVSDRDRHYIQQAIVKARRQNPAMSASVFDFLADVLLLNWPQGLPAPERAQWLDFVMRFQQSTGPVMAKALEDTALYRYNRLLSLNEVGSSPERFGFSLEAFHSHCAERQRLWPLGLSASSTHDTKRSEDVRARLSVLSEMPRQWRTEVLRWARLNKRKKPLLEGRAVPDRNEEYHIYQSLLGVWPPEGLSQELVARLMEYVRKALREAKVNSSWRSPNLAYEEAVLRFLQRILRPGGAFLSLFEPFAQVVAHYGWLNSLSQCVLKVAAPGVVDIYQGTELWSLTLVDPDNRREVDFSLRERLLRELQGQEQALGPLELSRGLLRSISDGRVKLYVLHKALGLRQRLREVFLQGQYVPLYAQGQRAEHVCAFMREHPRGRVLAVAGRFFVSLVGPGEFPLAQVWGDTFLPLPRPMRLRDVFTGQVLECASGRLALSAALEHFPVALLEVVE